MPHIVNFTADVLGTIRTKFRVRCKGLRFDTEDPDQLHQMAKSPTEWDSGQIAMDKVLLGDRLIPTDHDDFEVLKVGKVSDLVIVDSWSDENDEED